MKLKYLIIILLAVFAVIGLVGVLLFNRFGIIEVRVVPATINVSDHPGLVGDNDQLNFGSLPLYGESHKQVRINATRDVVVVIKVSGPISEFLFVDGDNALFFESGEGKEIKFKLIIPKGTSLGRKDGVVYFYFLDPRLKPFVIN